MTIVLLIVILLALFALAYLSKRRFGVLGLSLAAGVVLSQNAAATVATFFETNELPVAPLSYGSAANATLILAPALLMLLGGPRYTSRQTAVLGASGFALLGTFFLIGPLTSSLPPAELAVRDILILVSNWESAIVVVALVLALIDTFMAHGLRIKKPKAKRH